MKAGTKKKAGKKKTATKKGREMEMDELSTVSAGKGFFGVRDIIEKAVKTAKVEMLRSSGGTLGSTNKF